MGLSLGATEFIAKPYNRDALLGLLKKHTKECRDAPVLIIDGDEPARRSLTSDLEEKGWTVSGAADMEQGLQCARQHHPHVIIVGASMDDCDKAQIISAIRGSESLRSIPVITARLDSTEIAGILEGDTSIVEAASQVVEQPGDVLTKIRTLLRELETESGNRRG